MPEQIKPCPWCYADAHLERIRNCWYVQCEDSSCSANGPIRTADATAITAWNEVAELKAIVDGRPKTGDGVPVDVFRGDLVFWYMPGPCILAWGTVYGWQGQCVDPPQFCIQLAGDEHKAVAKYPSYRNVLCSKCYSTRSAAEAARKKGNPDG